MQPPGRFVLFCFVFLKPGSGGGAYVLGEDRCVCFLNVWWARGGLEEGSGRLLTLTVSLPHCFPKVCWGESFREGFEKEGSWHGTGTSDWQHGWAARSSTVRASRGTRLIWQFKEVNKVAQESWLFCD